MGKLDAEDPGHIVGGYGDDQPTVKIDDPLVERTALVISVDHPAQAIPVLAGIHWGNLWQWMTANPIRPGETYIRLIVAGEVVLELTEPHKENT